jgi:exosome complex RNA-binding protein Rrp4
MPWFTASRQKHVHLQVRAPGVGYIRLGKFCDIPQIHHVMVHFHIGNGHSTRQRARKASIVFSVQQLIVRRFPFQGRRDYSISLIGRKT